MMTEAPIYLDYAATTPMDARVLQAMQPYFADQFGNPSSIHRHGQRAEAAVEQARETVAHILGCQPGEIIFTSCGSESDNLALRGVALAAQAARGADHILISPVEHHAVSETAKQLGAHFGFDVEYLPVDRYGQVDPDEIRRRLRATTALVSVIYANNEIGTINPLAEIGAICRQRGIPLHTDAVQAGAYLDLDVDRLLVDLMSLGAHKFYGPKGVGVLYVRQGVRLLPMLTGGGQEHGLRAGTSNVPYLVGLAEALRLSQSDRPSHIPRLQALRDELLRCLPEVIPETRITGHPSERLPNHASFVFRDVDGNALLTRLDLAGFACSSGSACKTGLPEPSDVLVALGLPPEWALGSLRVTLGSGTVRDHMTALIDQLPALVRQGRRMKGTAT